MEKAALSDRIRLHNWLILWAAAAIGSLIVPLPSSFPLRLALWLVLLSGLQRPRAHLHWVAPGLGLVLGGVLEAVAQGSLGSGAFALLGCLLGLQFAQERVSLLALTLNLTGFLAGAGLSHGAAAILLPVTCLAQGYWRTSRPSQYRACMADLERYAGTLNLALAWSIGPYAVCQTLQVGYCFLQWLWQMAM